MVLEYQSLFLTREINFHLYKMFFRHRLEKQDYRRRLSFCQWIVNKFAEADFSAKMIIEDEAAFEFNGRVYSRNLYAYARKGDVHHFAYDVPHSWEKVTVLGAVRGNGYIIGPYFSDKNVNLQRYLNIIDEQVLPDLNDLYEFNFLNEARFNQEI